MIYVQNVPAASADPNHSSCSGTACNGDVNVSGTLNGQLTIASEDDIDITGDVKYHQYPGGNDVLGLVADNDVAVVHARGRERDRRPDDRRRDHVAQPLVLRAELVDRVETRRARARTRARSPARTA